MKKWICCIAAGALLWVMPSSGEARMISAERWQLLLAAPWYGSYVCNQGLTRLQLMLRPLAAGENLVEAEFNFSADPDNPTVPTGSFRLTGSLNPTSGIIVLKQDRWLIQPADLSYRMVDLEGRLMIGAGQAMIRGKMTTYGCQDFAVWQFYSDAAISR